MFLDTSIVTIDTLGIWEISLMPWAVKQYLHINALIINDTTIAAMNQISTY